MYQKQKSGSAKDRFHFKRDTCPRLLGKGWPLGPRLWCITVSFLLSHWYPGSGVVLDCIDS